MKRVEMEQVFSPRMGWDRDCIGSYEDGQWGEYVDGDKPADGKPLPAGSVTISGGFRYAEIAIAIKGGRIVDWAISCECTWWDDGDTTATYAPDEGETIYTTTWSSEPDPIEDSLRDDHLVSYDPEERGDPQAPIANWREWPASDLRRIGAFRDADDRHAEAVKEIKAAKKAAYDRLVAEANDTWGRYADKLLKARLAGGWSREAPVQDAVWELVKAPNVVKRLKHVPGGVRMIDTLRREFKAPTGPDILMDALKVLSGPRMDHAVTVAACILS